MGAIHSCFVDAHVLCPSPRMPDRTLFCLPGPKAHNA